MAKNKKYNEKRLTSNKNCFSQYLKTGSYSSDSKDDEYDDTYDSLYEESSIKVQKNNVKLRNSLGYI